MARSDLPNEAGDLDARQFDPNDDWIKDASRELQIEAMRQWFYDRYEDPANETPYDGKEGGYIFVWGGPYDPSDVIQERFSEFVDFDVMWELIEDLHTEVGDEWAPIDREGVDYDDALSMLVRDREDPTRMLAERLRQIEAVLTVDGDAVAKELATQLAHGAAITALEAYLWDIVAYWVVNDPATLRTMVATNKDFQAKSLQLSAIFARMDGLKAEVESYLQDLVWHRLDKVKPLMELGLRIKIPDIGDLMREVLTRHDIVHRGGRTKDGEVVSVSIEDVRRTVALVQGFAKEIDEELLARYPVEAAAKSPGF